MDKKILITCTGLNDCKKSDTNAEQDSVLSIILRENIEKLEQLSSTSSWVNIDLTDYLDIQGTSNMSFNFITESIHNLAKFDIELRNGNR